MEMMSVEVLDRICDKCKALKYYRVGIFCEDRSRARTIQDVLLTAWSGTTGHHRLGGMDVSFPETGSFVRILTYAEVSTGSARGNRFHEICIDNDVAPITEQIRDALTRTVVPYHIYDYDEDAECVRTVNLGADDVFNRFKDWWISTGQYEFSIDGGNITLKNKVIPDFGSFEPSLEILDFIRGAYGTA